MVPTVLRLEFLERHSEYGAFVLRLFLAFVLMYGTQDNILSREQMIVFGDFLERNGFPYPMLSAHLSVYAQFGSGLLILLGLYTRLAALVMCVNFLVALVMVHVGLPFDANIAPLAMFFGSVFLLFHGAGPLALDNRVAGIVAGAGEESGARTAIGAGEATGTREMAGGR